MQEARLKDHYILEASDFLLTSDPPFRPKPAPDLFNEALKLWGNPNTERILMVGDNPICDIEGAQKLGISTCWINGKKKLEEFPTEVTSPTLSFSTVLGLYESVSKDKSL